MKLLIANRAYSSWSLRGWLAAKLSMLPFTCDVVPMDTPEWTARLAEIPSGKVPVLWDGGEPVWDSMAIVMWLADKGGHDRFWPRDLHARRLAYSMSAEMHSGFQALRSGCPMNLLMRFPDFAASAPAAVVADVARIDALWTEARTRFGEALDEPYLFGHFSAVDIMYAPVVFRLAHYGLPLSETAQHYVDSMLAHPWMQEWATAARAETFELNRYDVPGGVKL